jgi:hypothetical protein
LYHLNVCNICLFFLLKRSSKQEGWGCIDLRTVGMIGIGNNKPCFHLNSSIQEVKNN